MVTGKEIIELIVDIENEAKAHRMNKLVEKSTELVNTLASYQCDHCKNIISSLTNIMDMATHTHKRNNNARKYSVISSMLHRIVLSTRNVVRNNQWKPKTHDRNPLSYEEHLWSI